MRKNLKGKKLKILSRKLQFDPTSHTVNPFVQTSLFASIHCKEHWPGLRPLVFTAHLMGSPLGLLLGNLLTLWVMDFLQL